MGKELFVKYRGKRYSVSVVNDEQARNYLVTLDKEKDALSVNCPKRGNEAGALKAAKSCLPSLYWLRIKQISPYKDGYLYLFGEKVYVGQMNEEDLDILMKKKALPYYRERVAHFEKEMGIINPYKVKVRTMKTRYGVNSRRTHSITLQTQLVSFPPEIIDSVVVHELAHHFVFNHSKAFYDVVCRYCPDYKILIEKLRTKQYERKIDLPEQPSH